MTYLLQKPAFTKSRNQDRHRHGQAQVEGLSPIAAAPPLRRPLSFNQPHGSQLDGSGRPGSETDGGLLLVRPPSTPPPVANAPSADIGVDSSLQAGVIPSGGALGVGATKGAAPAPAKAFGVGGAGDVRVALHVQQGEGTLEETKATSSALDDRVLMSDAATAGDGFPIESAGRGSGKGKGSGVFPSEPCCPCHGGSTLGVALGDADGEVPLDELERGRAGPGRDSTIAAGSE